MKQQSSPAAPSGVVRSSAVGRHVPVLSSHMSLVQNTTLTFTRSQTNAAAHVFISSIPLHPRIQRWNDPWRGYQSRALLAAMTCLRAEVVNRHWTHTHCAGGACALGLPRADCRVVGSEVLAQGAAKPAGGADTLGTMHSSTPPSFALSHSLPLSHSYSFTVLLVVSVHDGLCLCSKNKNWAVRKRLTLTVLGTEHCFFKQFLNTFTHLIKKYVFKKIYILYIYIYNSKYFLKNMNKTYCFTHWKILNGSYDKRHYNYMYVYK